MKCKFGKGMDFNMLDSFWKQIKSGSDIRGVAIDSVKGEKISLTNEVVEKICLAFAKWISKKANLDYPSITVALGHDSRLSASRIKNASINALRSVGVNVYDCSLCSTPAMFMATAVLACTASIEITASHHPANRNGFKFFTAEGGLSGTDVEEILQFAQDKNFPPIGERGNVRSINLMNYYCENLSRLIKEGINSKENYDEPLKKFKIVVDAGNGAGGFFVNNILKPLGADTNGSMFLKPDGNFPNHIPNPENPKVIKCISDAAVKAGADLGIIFDTDVDRVAVVDDRGKAIAKNKLIALSSVIALKNSSSGIIVTDSVTSDHLRTFIEKLGGTQFRYKRGYHNVISMAKKINEKGADCPLAIESSGHAAFKENNFIDDGAYLAAKIIIETVNLRKKNKTLDDLLKDFVDAKEQVSIRIPINKNNAANLSKKILAELKTYAQPNKLFDLDKENIEGVKINFRAKHQNGWLLLRKSIHDPMMVLYTESYVNNGVKSILSLIKPFLKRYPDLDLSEFEKYSKNKS